MKKIRVAKNNTLSVTAGVTAAATGVTMLIFDGSTATAGAAVSPGGKGDDRDAGQKDQVGQQVSKSAMLDHGVQ